MTENQEASERLEKAAAEARDACRHPKVMPKYDPDVGRKLSSAQVRTVYPRFFGTCPDCGRYGIIYASYEHFIAGDW